MTDAVVYLYHHDHIITVAFVFTVTAIWTLYQHFTKENK